MISIKTPKEIEEMRIGGRILSEVLNELLKNIKPGITELEIDKLAEKLIRQKGAEPGFKKVPNYNYSICCSTNNVVVHGVPTNYKLKKGDVAGIDCGVFYKGFHTDMAETIVVGGHQEGEVNKFLEIGKRALNAGVKSAKSGNRVGHISKSIQEIVEGQGYSIVKSLVGHGVGKDLHEEPEIPGYLAQDINKTQLLKPGMTIAIEVIYNMGSDEVMFTNDDGWTISTGDGSISGLFERTVAVTQNGPKILTK
jgi:methionyl aminopeptidase